MISPLLTGTFRTCANYNASAKTIRSVTSLNFQRGIHVQPIQHQTSQFPRIKLSAHIRRSIDRDAGVAPKPKEPLPPFFRFMQQVRPSLKAERPHLKSREIIAAITEKWKSLETKEKEILSKEYHNDMKKYYKENANYKPTLTVEDKGTIEQKLADTSRKKLILAYQKQARELNKPKKPSSSFLRFFHIQTDRQPNETYKEHMQRMSVKWKAFSAYKKKKYRTTPEEMENYKTAMMAWEAAITKSIEAGDVGGIAFTPKSNEPQEYAEDDEFEEEEF